MNQTIIRIIILFGLLLSVNCASGQITIHQVASKDAAIGYHDNFNYGNTNYGNAFQNAAYVIPGNYGGINVNRALIYFDLSGIPVDAEILNAYINLYALGPSGTLNGHAGPGNEGLVLRITQPWEEFTVTWNNQPDYTTQNQVFLPASISPVQDYTQIEITSLLKDIFLGPNYGILIRLVDESPTNALLFRSLNTSDPGKFPTIDVTYRVFNPPSIQITSQINACAGDPVSINANVTAAYPPVLTTWTYPDGTVHYEDPVINAIEPSDEGFYIIHVTDAMSYTSSDSVLIIIGETPEIAFSGLDSLKVEAPFILSAGEGMKYYQWNTGQSTENISIENDGWYYVTVQSPDGCSKSDSVYVEIIKETGSPCIFIPNAFTPDQDGLNSVFLPVISCPVIDYKLQIYNRLGDLLFTSPDLNIGWDGKYHSALCPGNVYIYRLSFKMKDASSNEQSQVYCGNVLLLR
jgi:gliding motility-associated-like protein